MTKREAKRWACREAADILQGYLDAGSHFRVTNDSESQDNPATERVYAAVEELIAELDRRGGR